MTYITKGNNLYANNHQNNFMQEYFLPQFNNYEFSPLNNMMAFFQALKLNPKEIRNILNLNEFHFQYKKLSHASSLLPDNIMKNHPLFSNFVSNTELQIKIDELRKENIELKKQLANHKK